MPASSPSETESAIHVEIVRALVHFKAGADTLAALDVAGYPQPVVYDTFRRLGARSDLLAIVGSWEDTMIDVWVLDALQQWNSRTGRS